MTGKNSLTPIRTLKKLCRIPNDEIGKAVITGECRIFAYYNNILIISLLNKIISLEAYNSFVLKNGRV